MLRSLENIIKIMLWDVILVPKRYSKFWASVKELKNTIKITEKCITSLNKSMMR